VSDEADRGRQQVAVVDIVHPVWRNGVQAAAPSDSVFFVRCDKYAYLLTYLIMR